MWLRAKRSAFRSVFACAEASRVTTTLQITLSTDGQEIRHAGAGRSVLPAMALLIERMGRFASEGLSIDLFVR